MPTESLALFPFLTLFVIIAKIKVEGAVTRILIVFVVILEVIIIIIIIIILV